MKYQVLLLFCLDAWDSPLIPSTLASPCSGVLFFLLLSTEVNPPLNRATVIAWAVQCCSNIA